MTGQTANPRSTNGASASPAPAIRLSLSPALLREGLARPLQAGGTCTPLLARIISKFGPPRRSVAAAPAGIAEALGSPAPASAPSATAAAAAESPQAKTP